ncbi:GTPase [Streptomyces sp. NPDC059894]|uniref:GTPase n=1 Tax=unclassified Streptomyces TaxID=2593676 RepID=UPI003662B28D
MPLGEKEHTDARKDEGRVRKDEDRANGPLGDNRANGPLGDNRTRGPLGDARTRGQRDEVRARGRQDDDRARGQDGDGRAPDRAADRAGDRAPDRAPDCAADRAGDRAADRAPARTADRAGDRTPDRTADRAADRAPARAPLRPRPDDAPVRAREGERRARGGRKDGHARGREDDRRPRGRDDNNGHAPAAAPDPADTGPWDDGLIARRVNETAEQPPAMEIRTGGSQTVPPLAYDGPLRSRLDALRELVGLSRARLDNRTLAEAGRVLDEAQARRRLSGQHTVVAIAGATGSGKSQLFNALAGVTISDTGVRRPTTAAPIACSWSDGAGSLIDRLGIPGRLRRRPVQSADAEAQLRGLVLIDLPDHDSAAVQHREQVDRVLALVDAVIWVVDPEKYADAVLHERYLRPLAGHAEIMFIVLNQVDRLPGEAAEMVLDDLRRLLDEDGIALGEYGEPGATVLALSALTGDGVGELRELLGQFVAERGAPARRISADVDAAARRLRPVYATGRRTGLSEEAREEFAARLADAVGATAAGEAAERAWLRNANRACGTPWLRLWRWCQGRSDPATGPLPARAQADEEVTARQRVEQAVRTVSERASVGLPAPWAQAVKEAAVRGAQGLPEALDELALRAGLPPGRPPRPGWWPMAVLTQAAMTILQVVGGLWLVCQIAGLVSPNLGVPVLLMVAGIVGGPLVEWGCRMAARGPARRYGQDAERRLRETAAGCGRARVLDPVAAELLRYREVREQYGRVTGVEAVAR